MKYVKTPFIKGMIILHLVLMANYCYSQLIIKDSETGEPIPFVNILSASRQVMDIPDIHGKVDVKNMAGANLQGVKKKLFFRTCLTKRLKLTSTPCPFLRSFD